MSRAAVYNLLTEDPELNDLGLNEDTVFHNWSSEERPTDTTAFAILRWEDEGKPIWGSERERNVRRLTIWVHWPKELTNDFNRVTAVLDRIDDVLAPARDIPGDDGYSLSFVDFGGRSADIIDEGFNTITRNASYGIYSVSSS